MSVPSLLSFDGRGAWPWILVFAYAAVPFAILLLIGRPPNDHYVGFVFAVMAASIVLSALGPLFIVFYLLLILSVFAGRTPYIGDCKSLGDEFMFYIPMTIALPGACLATSLWIYRLGREALHPQSRRLGNIVFPFVGLLSGWTTMFAAQRNIDWALESGWVCGGG